MAQGSSGHRTIAFSFAGPAPVRLREASMYRYNSAGSLENKPKVRDGECVALVQEYAGAPRSTTWRAGERVVESRGLLPGTAIATFANGRFPSGTMRRHAAFFLRYGPRDASGNATYFWVIEQYNHPPIALIQARMLNRKRGPQARDGSWPEASNNPDAFYVIE